jgi:hypothetical protein
LSSSWEGGRYAPFCLEGIRDAQGVRKALQRGAFKLSLKIRGNFDTWRMTKRKTKTKKLNT